MNHKSFQASLSRSQGRNAWCVLFRHPMRTDKSGKTGLRVRRGLGTDDKVEAQGLVDQLNSLLSDNTMWNISSKTSAESLYDPRVVSAFYDYLTLEIHNPWEVRNKALALPGAEQGYARALLIGTTGAGKTTLLRQLIGTTKNERFPSTSTAKTTTSNLEIVLNDTTVFKAVVTFFTQGYVRQHIEECIISAALAWLDTNQKEEVERKFLEHSEQRFRLSYLLGTLDLMKRSLPKESSPQHNETDFEWFDENVSDGEDNTDDIELASQERQALYEKLNHYINAICQLASTTYERVTKALNEDVHQTSDDDIAVIYELVGGEFEADERYYELVDEIIDDVQSRFRRFSRENLTLGKDGWPLYLSFQAPERTEFIKQITKFTSNYAPSFGTLLTPLVEGLRVSGPFMPAWKPAKRPQIVLMDGEGLGHTPDSNTSVSTNITTRYKDVDAIILVDNATQPMQAAPTMVLRNLVATGHHPKLLVAFTHFDAVTGDNFVNVKMKVAHVLRSYENAVAFVGKALGDRAEMALNAVEKSKRIYFLSNLHRFDTEEVHTAPNVKQLDALIEQIHHLSQPEEPAEGEPFFDAVNLILGIRDATEEFHKLWRARLKLEVSTGVRPEHWTRVKALTRRLGELGLDEYDNLKPVADLQKYLGEEIYRYLQHPIAWKPSNTSDEAKTQAIAKITREVDGRLYQFVTERIFLQKTQEWYQAYCVRGIGSTRTRAGMIRDILDGSAPIPTKILTPEDREFLLQLQFLVQDAIRAGGGSTRG